MINKHYVTKTYFPSEYFNYVNYRKTLKYSFCLVIVVYLKWNDENYALPMNEFMFLWSLALSEFSISSTITR